MTEPLEIDCGIHGAYCDVHMRDADSGTLAFTLLLRPDEAIVAAERLRTVADKLEEFWRDRQP